MEQKIVCRTCLRATENYVSIFSAPELWGKKIVIAKLIMACAPVVIKIGDGLPTKICDNCLQLLQLSFLFRLRVITANENYKEIIRTQVSSDSWLQVVTDKRTMNLNQIYSTDYILESINDGVKIEPLDIKEEIQDNCENSASSNPVKNHNTKIITTTSVDKNHLNSVTPNTKVIQNNGSKEITNKNATVSCVEKKQSTNNNNNKLCKNSKTTDKGEKILFDKVEFSFPSVQNTRLVADGQNIIIGNEEQIDNELNLKLINNKNRIKRTYSKVDSSNTNSSSKIAKLQNNSMTSIQIELLSDDELNQKPLNKLNHSKSNIKSNECIIIED